MSIFKNIIKIFVLGPLSLLYGTIVGVRNIFFNARILSSKEYSVPVISIGNITVGGTGKTPHTEILINNLKNEFKVAYLSRGYKRKSKGFILATNDSTATQIGDEPKQIKNKFPNIIVAVDKNRCRGIEKLMALENPPDVIILDDAFQHRYVKPDLSIVLSDYNRPFYEDYIMPYGRLRESRKSKERANIFVVTKCPETMTPIERRIISQNIGVRPFQKLYFTQVKYGELTPVFNNTEYNLPERMFNYTALLLSGIANPKPLREHLNNAYKNVIQITYPDHYNFSKKDIKEITSKYKQINSSDKIIITTEKDAMRLRLFDFEQEVKDNLFYIPIESEFMYTDKEDYMEQIVAYVRKNKRMF